MAPGAGADPTTWRTFLAGHASELWAMDLTTQPLWNYSMRYILVLLELRSRTVSRQRGARRRALDRHNPGRRLRLTHGAGSLISTAAVRSCTYSKVTPLPERIQPDDLAEIVSFLLRLPNNTSVPEMVVNTRLESGL